MPTEKVLTACSFCGRWNTEVRNIVVGDTPDAPAICDRCIASCVETLREENPEAYGEWKAGDGEQVGN